MLDARSMKDHGIICVGEILWDSLPAGLLLGGAPYNVAHDLHMMGCDVKVISRVGRDFLGEEIVGRVGNDGMSVELIQVDEKLPTGFVQVTSDVYGSPRYRISEPAAWDAIEADDKVVNAVKGGAVVVFGTLACRSKVSRETIRTLTGSARLKALDVNLRPGGGSIEIVEELLRAADIIKTNSFELDEMRKWFGLPAGDREACEDLARKFSCEIVSVSNGAHGGELWHSGNWVRHPGFSVHPQNSIGAGDAFLAGLLASFLEGKHDEEIIETANLVGAYVVTRTAAAPQFGRKALEPIKQNINAPDNR